MRLPRDVDGEDLIRRLRRRGHQVTRQVGSHVRLTATVRGQTHHVTIPLHRPLRVGTLRAILNMVADQLGVERDALVREPFGR